MTKIFLFCALTFIASCSKVPVNNSETFVWPKKPVKLSKINAITSKDSFYWRLSGGALPLNYDVYGLDTFDTKDAEIEYLKTNGKALICYVSAHYESWRPDAKDFPKSVVKENLGDWKGEQVVDIREWEKLSPLYEKRIQLCRYRGFDAIEWDNIDQKASGVNDKDLTVFIKRLVALSNKYDLPVIQKNLSEKVNELEPIMGGAIAESCNVYGECNSYRPFFLKGKPVFMIEYIESNCKAKTFGRTYLANKSLNGKTWRECK